MFLRVLKKLNSEAQDYLHKNGLSDPGVFESFLGDPSTELQELAFEPGDIPTLQELLQQAHRAARGQSRNRTPKSGRVHPPRETEA